MSPHNEAAALGANRDGGEVVTEALVAHFYLNPTISATDLAAAVIGARFGLSACVARLVVELAGIGGWFA